MKIRVALLTSLVVLTLFSFVSALAEEWSVPLSGNAYRTAPDPGGLAIGSDGYLELRKPGEVYSVYFRVDRPGRLTLAVHGRATENRSPLHATVGDETLTTELQNEPVKRYPLGEIEVASPGYVQVKLQQPQSDTKAVLKIDQLIVTSNVEGMQLVYVKSNAGNMFYWGRRGPSVHLSYPLPKNINLTYSYNEVTIPIGHDPIGSYFMANGFGEGYFGIQVNSATQRRVLFSVWSPYSTDNPSEIPESDRVVATAKGTGVHAQDFGNEGSGGQSFLVYPWKAGVTYRFLTEVQPDGKGNTQYTAWFGEKEAQQWRLVASFRRPKTDKHLTGFHSFLENFSPTYGHLVRRAEYANQWVGDVDGNWHPLNRARFTADATARGQHRLDYAGGSEGQHFFLENCGFFDEPVKLDQIFERSPTASLQPDIDFDSLPRGNADQ